MQPEDKDVFIVIGPSCTGKSTLKCAMAGQKMKFINKKDYMKVPFVEKANSACFIVPVDDKGVPMESQLMSHKNAPYTLKA